MNELLASYPASGLVWIALSLFLIGMSKGGFPVGTVAMPLLVLMWPGETGAARAAVGFLLPMLCLMDIGAVWLYRTHIDWSRIRRMLPGSLVGVAIAAGLFISDQHALIHVTDAVLRIAIGTLGLLFVGWYAAGKWILARLAKAHTPGPTACFAYGAAAGITSSLAHAAGPVMQMALLPQRLPKMQFAATMTAYFFTLNLIKMVPFTLLGRIKPEFLLLGLIMLPIIPIAVLSGFLLVRITKDHHYTAFIYVALAITSLFLILDGINA